MNRNYAIDDSIWSVYSNNNDVLDIIQRYNISLHRDDGGYKTVSSILSELSHCMMKCLHPSDSRRIGDAMLSLSESIATLEELIPPPTEELDTFLQSFKVKDKEVRRNE